MQRLAEFAIADGGGADDEGAIGDGFGDGRIFAGVSHELRGADGGFGFAPGGFVGSDEAEVGRAEITDGAGRGSDVEGIAGGDEDDAEIFEMRGGWQRAIPCPTLAKKIGGWCGWLHRIDSLANLAARNCAPTGLADWLLGPQA